MPEQGCEHTCGQQYCHERSGAFLRLLEEARPVNVLRSATREEETSASTRDETGRDPPSANIDGRAHSEKELVDRHWKEGAEEDEQLTRSIYFAPV